MCSMSISLIYCSLYSPWSWQVFVFFFYLDSHELVSFSNTHDSRKSWACPDIIALIISCVYTECSFRKKGCWDYLKCQRPPKITVNGLKFKSRHAHFIGPPVLVILECNIWPSKAILQHFVLFLLCFVFLSSLTVIPTSSLFLRHYGKHAVISDKTFIMYS